MGSQAQAIQKRAWNAAALGLAAYAILIGAFFWRHVFTSDILAQGDSLLLFYPAWDFRAAALRAWRLPLWNPITFMGAPFLANSQYGVLYPPNWPLAWLAAPDAVKISMLAHLLLAAAGARLFARQRAGLGGVPAWFAGVLFALGGYLTAKVGQINQLQGLAWLPWAFWAASGLGVRPRPNLALLGAFLALQILAGHAQTFSITLTGVLWYSLLCGLFGWRYRPTLPESGSAGPRRAFLAAQVPMALTVGAAVLAVVLAAAQVLPTLELTSESVRAGGLPPSEVLSFSLDPRLLGHALLPVFTHPLFSEYQSTIGIAGLCLCIIGVLAALRLPSRERRAVFALAGLALLGLFFALGQFNPIYVGLARYAPGFNLFRVPARWLALTAFALAILAGKGMQSLIERKANRLMAAVCLGGSGLIALSWLARGITPAGETGPLPPPMIESSMWLATLIVVVVLALFLRRAALRAGLVASIAIVELFAASLIQPFNRLAPREAYLAMRPSVAYLVEQARGQTPPGRVLAQSRLFYDPTQEGIPLAEVAQAAGLSTEATYQYIVAAKYQDVLSHNMALAWGLPTLDGYDGGILPLRNYILFAEYLMGRPPLTRDGRLRESLDLHPRDHPDGRSLSLANGQYLIADQTFDAWEDDVYFDLTHHARLSPGQSAEVPALPDFAAGGLGVISFLEGASDLPDGAKAAEVQITFEGGAAEVFTLRAGRETAEGLYESGSVAHRRASIAGNYWPDEQAVNDYVAWFRWPETRRVKSIEVRSALAQGDVLVRGLTLINDQKGTFEPLVISSTGRFRLAFRADVKVYENLDVLPRAFMVSQAEVAAGDEAALARMREAGFDPATTVILHDGEALSGPALEGVARIETYTPEQIVIDTEADTPGYLVLSDAWYPGWEASVDGTSVSIHRADLLFRALAVPAGQHTIIFVYRPAGLGWGIALSLAGLAAVAVVLLREVRKKTAEI